MKIFASHPSRLFVGILAIGLASSTGISLAQVTTGTWIGVSNTDFQNSSNWSGGVPTSTRYALFQGTPTANQPTLTNDRTLNGLSFTSAAGGWTVGGPFTLVISGGGNLVPVLGIQTIGQSSGTNTINANVTVNGSGSVTTQNWSVGSGGTLVVNGNIAGNSTILQIGTANSGTGTLILNGSNSRSSATQLIAGTVEIGANNALGSGTTTVLGTANNGVGATLAARGGARSLSNAFALESGVALTVGGANNLTLSGDISGAGNLTVSSGRLILTGANTGYSGTATVQSAGVLQIANGSNSGNLTSAGIELSGTLVINRSNAFTFSSQVISGNGTVEHLGAGTTAFNSSAASTFNGNVRVGNGRLNLNTLNALGGNANTGTWTVDSGATLGFNQGTRTRAGNTVNNGTIVGYNGAGTIGNGLVFSAGTMLTGVGNFQVDVAKGGTADFSFGGTVAPGTAPDSAGKFSFGNGSVATAAQFLSGSTIVWDLTSTGGVAGTDYDAFDLIGGSTVSISLGANLQIDLGFAWDEANPYWLTDHTYTLFSTSAVTGSFTLQNAVYSGAGGTGTFTFNGQDIIYSYTAIPEPQTCILIALGLGVMLVKVQSRHRRNAVGQR
jgi:fibronectin-binding autotransporter adhesin